MHALTAVRHCISSLLDAVHVETHAANPVVWIAVTIIHQHRLVPPFVLSRYHPEVLQAGEYPVLGHQASGHLVSDAEAYNLPGWVDVGGV